MYRLARFFVSVLVPGFILVGASTSPAIAAEKAKVAVPKYEQKELLDNDKVRVLEARWAPGAESPSVARPYRVIRTLKGGTLQRIHPDGRKESVRWKTGEVKAFDASEPYIAKNIGKSEVVLYVVTLK